MRYLRDTSFVAWVVIIAILGGVLLFARGLGEDAEIPPPPGTTAGTLIGPADSDAVAVIDELKGLAPYGIAAGTDAATLTEWAEQVSLTAAKGAELRAAEGAPASDNLYASFAMVAATADRLTDAAADPVAAPSLRTSILLGIDRAANIAAGIPVPDGVEGLTGGALTPSELLPPTTPENSEAPTLPTPTPGAGHGHPEPDLDLDSPNPGDLS